MTEGNPRKQIDQTSHEIALGKISLITEAIVSVINNTVKWAGLSFIGYITYLIIKELAGQQTVAKIALSFMTDIKINQWLAYVVGIGGVGYGCIQRKSRKDTIERLSNRKEQLEKMIDPNRKSSRLTPRGETRPEDR